MQISSFLKQFEILVHNKKVSQQFICEILSQHLKKEFYPEEIKVSKDILYINKDVFIKNAILFKKEKILHDINTVSKTTLKDIQ